MYYYYQNQKKSRLEVFSIIISTYLPIMSVI